MDFYNELIFLIHKRFKSDLDKRAIRSYVNKLIVSDRLIYEIEDSVSPIFLRPLTHYSALLLHGIKIPRTVIGDYLYVHDRGFYYQWSGAKLERHSWSPLLEEMLGGHWWTVTPTDRLTLKTSEIEESYEKRIKEILYAS